jgi:NADH:ubiquinone oxidoreductase subunit C
MRFINWYDDYDLLDPVEKELDFSKYVLWYKLKFINLFSLMTLSIIKEFIINNNDIEIKTTAKNIEALLWLLKYNSLTHFEQNIEIVAADAPTNKFRFKVVYVLRSLLYNSVITVSFTTHETNLKINSINYLYKSSMWLEREVWDMFGIKFNNNLDLRRILTDYGFHGHPLRKDFPLSGFKEVYYDDSSKRIIFEPVELAQELRIFTFQKRTSNLK